MLALLALMAWKPHLKVADVPKFKRNPQGFSRCLVRSPLDTEIHNESHVHRNNPVVPEVPIHDSSHLSAVLMQHLAQKIR